MNQITLGLDPLHKKTRKEVFLEEMNKIVPWQALVALIQPHARGAHQALGGRPPFAVETMLRPTGQAAGEFGPQGIAVNALWPRTIIATDALNMIPGVEIPRCRTPQIVADAAHAVLVRRADGYHELQTVFQLLDWGDTVWLKPREDGEIRRIGDGGYGVAEADDLVVRAAKSLQKTANCPLGADIRVEKRIPLGGGFGGGSSDAATVLVALDHLWGTGLDADRLAALGLALGADVPVFVRGRSAWAEGVGEELEPVELPPAAYLVVDSGISVPTAELFQSPGLTRDAPAATMRDFVSGSVLGNAFEPVLRRRSPAIASVLDTLAQLGPAALTGTGGGCFARFGARAEAEAALARLPPGLRAWVAMGVDVSPLHRALSAGRAGNG